MTDDLPADDPATQTPPPDDPATHDPATRDDGEIPVGQPLPTRGRRPSGLVAVAGVVLGLVVAAGIWFVIGQGPSDAKTLETATPLMSPERAPTTTGTDTTGQSVKLVSTAPRTVSLLYFGYTHCPDVCPLDMGEMSEGLQQLTKGQRARVRLVFVTVDPARDTPPVLRTWLNHFSSGFIGVVPTPAESKDVLHQLDLSPPTTSKVPGGGYTVSHVGGVFAFTGDGSAHVEFTEGSPAGQIAHDLRLLLNGWNDSYFTS